LNHEYVTLSADTLFLCHVLEVRTVLLPSGGSWNLYLLWKKILHPKSWKIFTCRGSLLLRSPRSIVFSCTSAAHLYYVPLYSIL